MKKQVITLFGIICAVYAHAQNDETDRYKYRAQVNYVYAMPQGQFSFRGGKSITGQCAATSGINGSFGIILEKRFSISLQIADEKYRVQQASLNNVMLQQYGMPGFYTTINKSMPYTDVFSAGAVLAYSRQYRTIEIEPYVVLGFGYVHMGGDNIGSIYRKMKNDNYAEYISQTIDYSRGSIFYPGLGLRLNKQICGALYGTVGIQYNQGDMNYTVIEDKTDYLYSTSTVKTRSKQTISTLQLQAGIQVRFRRSN